jgi:hypothetical protein
LLERHKRVRLKNQEFQILDAYLYLTEDRCQTWSRGYSKAQQRDITAGCACRLGVV